MNHADGAVRSIRLEDREFTFTVRRTRRARRLSLRIDAEHGLVAVLPFRSPEWLLVEFLRKKSAWVIRHLDEAAHRKNSRAELATGAMVPFFGDELTLDIRRHDRKRAVIQRKGVVLQIHLPPEYRGELRALIQLWLIGAAREVVPFRVGELNKNLGFRYGKVTVRNQKTRWGSCSRTGTLSFNWRLVLLPPGVMDYLILHELAHTREMNHSERFWALVGSICPDYRAHEAWLRRNGKKVGL